MIRLRNIVSVAISLMVQLIESNVMESHFVMTNCNQENHSEKSLRFETFGRLNLSRLCNGTIKNNEELQNCHASTILREKENLLTNYIVSRKIHQQSFHSVSFLDFKFNENLNQKQFSYFLSDFDINVSCLNTILIKRQD